MTDVIKDELKGILTTALDAINPTAEDRKALIAYGVGAAELCIAAKLADTPEAKEEALKSAQGYLDAISLVVARYQVKAAVASERALLAVISGAVKLTIAAVA